MTILVHVFRSWATAQPVRPSERTFAERSPCALERLPAPRRPHLEMRWHLDAEGWLTCRWRLVSDTAPARLDDEEAKPPPWLWLLVRTDIHDAERQ